jgi:putative chitinase
MTTQITHALLIAADTRARSSGADFVSPLNQACEEFGITAPREIAAFIAQLAVESAGFTRLEEDLNYKTPERLSAIFRTAFPTPDDARPFVRNPERLANRVYANRLGNGDEASGDGWRFRGRGLKQLTGRANYTACFADLYHTAPNDPDRLLDTDGAARSATWFWWRNRCGAALELRGFDAVTRLVNGPGMAGAAERRTAYAQVLAVMGLRP